jgi:nitrite reductase/ring-hydroxylating ferredoxin subunit
MTIDAGAAVSEDNTRLTVCAVADLPPGEMRRF